jgi:hypothetical protein
MIVAELWAWDLNSHRRASITVFPRMPSPGERAYLAALADRLDRLQALLAERRAPRSKMRPRHGTPTWAR